MGFQPPRQFPPRPHANGHGPRPVAAGVPIVGQPVELTGWFPTVSFICRCASPGVPLLLCGLGNAIRCPSCGTHWAVTKVGFDATNPQSEIMLSRVGRSDAPASAAPPPPTDPPPSE
jgi:hypothetical protein